MKKLDKKIIESMVAASLLSIVHYTIAEQAEYQHFDLIEGTREDGWRRYVAVLCALASNGIGMVPLHPRFDKYVFGYVDGCFYPMLLQDDFDITSKPNPDGKSIQDLFAITDYSVHPEYAHFLTSHRR